MPRISVSVTKEFYNALEDYRIRFGMRSISEAMALLAYSCMVDTEQDPGGMPIHKWGGDRKTGKYKKDDDPA